MEAHARHRARTRNLDAARVGASGFEVILPMAVELGANGVVTPIAIGGFAPMTVSAGKWRLEGDALKFDVKTSGMAKGDVTLPEDSLHFRTAAWGGTMASRGNLMLLQTRFGFRREWRMVGVFKAEPLLDDDEDDDDRKGGEGGGGDEESREEGAPRVHARHRTQDVVNS